MSQELELWVPRVYRFALRLCDDVHSAEDLTQETMLRAWQRLGTLRDGGKMQVWLFRIAVNLWRDRLRRRASPISQAQPYEMEPRDRELEPPHLAAIGDEVQKTMAALRLLPDRQREVLYLCAGEEMSTSEIAEVLGISADSAKANLSLARKKMRDLFPTEEPVS